MIIGKEWWQSLIQKVNLNQNYKLKGNWEIGGEISYSEKDWGNWKGVVGTPASSSNLANVALTKIKSDNNDD